MLVQVRKILATALIAAVTPAGATDHKDRTGGKPKPEFNPVFVDVVGPRNVRAPEHGPAYKRVDCRGIEEWFHTPRTNYDSYETMSDGSICGLAEDLPIPVAKATPLRILDRVFGGYAR